MAETPREREDRLARELRWLYRQVFGTEAGKKVLYSILSDLGYHTTAEQPERVALRNYASFLIRERIGLNDAAGMVAIIDTLLEHAK